jgi:adenine-specific DNA methylase
MPRENGRMNSTNHCRRLIEVALPIREISAESVRDKGLPTAHISRLHKWWARRPLATARAVIFASLVPDPDDPRCPQAFKSAVEKHLKKDVPSILQFYVRGKNTITDKDPYRPYADIPDTLRNRLLTFIAKWSPVAIDFEMGNTSTKPKPAELLDDRSLVKWETSDPKNQQGREILRIAETLVKVAHDGARPSVLDPFAGGGAIPLEAGRLGCQVLANDYNPVAHLILRATCEFPQKYGKPGSRKIIAENFGKIREIETKVTNVLVHDIEVWAQWMLELSKKKLTTLYPPGKDGRPVLGYLWTHTAPCANPSCKGEIPLLKSLLVVKKNNKKYLLTMNLDKSKKVVQFGVDKVKSAKTDEGSMAAKGASCPFCHQITSTEYIKKASFDGSFGERMFAAIVEGKNGKEYRAIESHEVAAFDKAVLMLNPLDVPSEAMPDSPDFVSGRGWNYSSWGNLFNARQLLVLQTLIESLHKAEEKIRNTYSDDNYSTALCLYLGLWIDRIAVFGNSMSRWRDTKEEIENPFDGQALRMMLNYPEVNPFAAVSGSAPSQLKYMLKVIEHEQLPPDARSNGCSVFLGNAGSLPHKAETVDYVITDPPYYDAIAYADLSDFFYVWLKRSVGHLFPALFSTPLTPKSEEATSLRHRHNGSQAEAQRHYEKLLSESFAESLRVVRQPKLVAVMFAHQSTEAWTALISSLFKAGLTPDATWPIATEMPKTALALGTASLETSVTVICRPRNVGSASSFKDVRKEIEKVVQESVKRFWGYGFRGADLIVACYALRSVSSANMSVWRRQTARRLRYRSFWSLRERLRVTR